MQFSAWATQIRRLQVAIPLTAVLAATAVAIPTLALAGHQEAGVAEYTGCLNTGGNISNLAVGTAPKSTCSSTQTQVHLSGGDITAVETPTAGGLQGGSVNGEATIELQQSYKLPQTCSNGEVAKWQASGWVCATDEDTTYSGGDFATSAQSCPSGQFATGIDNTGALVCDAPAQQSLSVVKVDDQAEVPFAGANVADAVCPAGYQLVGGGWGTRDAVSDGADVYDYSSGPGPEGSGGPNAYDVGAATANPFGGTVYARAYCIKLD